MKKLLLFVLAFGMIAVQCKKHVKCSCEETTTIIDNKGLNEYFFKEKTTTTIKRYNISISSTTENKAKTGKCASFELESSGTYTTNVNTGYINGQPSVKTINTETSVDTECTIY